MSVLIVVEEDVADIEKKCICLNDKVYIEKEVYDTQRKEIEKLIDQLNILSGRKCFKCGGTDIDHSGAPAYRCRKCDTYI